jgi:hypothetical protein
LELWKYKNWTSDVIEGPMDKRETNDEGVKFRNGVKDRNGVMGGWRGDDGSW